MPQEKPKVTPKDFFLQLGTIVTLYWSAIALIILLFQIINSAFPSPLNMNYDPYQSGAVGAIASLVVVFPAFFIISFFVGRDLLKNPLKRELWIRKWLIYITLFVTGITMLIDLVVLVRTFLIGEEFTTNFLLKILSVFVVTALVFTYYILDIRREVPTKKSKNNNTQTIFSGVAIILVVTSIVSGFFVMGSPQAHRLLRYDDQRVNDLQSIQYQVVSFWQQKEKLPVDINEIQDPLVGFVVPKDPETGLAYRYEKEGDLTFKLCANFNLSSSDTQSSYLTTAPQTYLAYKDPSGIQYNWQHEKGENCFERTIDTQKFPPLNKINKEATASNKILQ
ncbi:MAG: DUF5671 domain-containing protein [Candidatus Paceibacterota bacterium]